MGRIRIGVLVVCGIVPTLFLLSLGALKLSSHSFILPFSHQPTVTQVTEAVHQSPPSSPTNPHPITNNNATYPRINLNDDYLSYRAQAREQLARIEAHRHTLFNGEHWNEWQIGQLVAYLKKAETTVDYVPPRVSIRWLSIGVVFILTRRQGRSHILALGSLRIRRLYDGRGALD
jgi:alpha-1,3(6)-mannosylglycoprotein beta-1,6-N-acetyl-glucosaminyltransferase